MPTSIHIPVMLDEVLEWLAPRPGQVLVDGTLGGGGHTRRLAERLEPGGLVIALDRDPQAVAAAEVELANLPVKAIGANFCRLPDVLAELQLTAVDGVLLDVGLSSDQLADKERGFSYDSEGPLDLRFDPTRGEPAWRLLQTIREEPLADLIYQYGEERFSRRIARRVVERRRTSPVKTAAALADLIRGCVPRSRGHAIDPATRTFQALRIAVNQELESLELALQRIPDCLKPGGRFLVISFHSLEDRLVKQAFRQDPRLENLTKKPLGPSEREAASNPRSRSARMRVAQRTAS